ncbi:MAG: radical SAM protein [Parasporobacterium sp.]|nr:radical SAM protein [Parasporobacterium sp.]
MSKKVKVDLLQLKKDQLKLLADYRKQLYQNPVLRFLFLELTLRCNERCLHCGSSCGDVKSEELTFQQYRKILDEVAEDFDLHTFQLCITGGEPLLRKDFFDIMGYANELGYSWGMTSNATLIDSGIARKLRESGMKTISVSIDGLPKSHDAFRRTPGGYEKAMKGIEALISEGGFQAIQVTTVLNHSNMDELDALYEIFREMEIDSWRVLGIEPMGRALQYPDLLLTEEDYLRLFDFIRDKRMEDMPVTYGCSHFLGYKFEREVRDYYFICNAGIYTASICCNGDIIGCLDIERRPEMVQGNILKDRFSDVWVNRFEFFRRGLDEMSEECSDCPVKEFCAGGARHSFDYDAGRQRMCFKDGPVFIHNY